MPRRSTGSPDPDRASDWARQLGAELYVLGDIVATGDQVRISAAMYEEGRPDAVATRRGRATERVPIGGPARRRLIAGRYGNPHQRLTRMAAMTTGSLEAFKSYLDGENAYREGRYAEAIDALQAPSTDSTFALAYYRLSDAADRAGRAELALRSAEQALPYREHLGERERGLIEAQHAWRQGRVEQAERLGRSLVADYPDDVEAFSCWLRCWSTAIRCGGVPRSRRASPGAGARPRPGERRGTDPPGPHRLASRAIGKRWIPWCAESAPAMKGSEVVETRAFRAFALGDRPGQKRVTQRFLPTPGECRR